MGEDLDIRVGIHRVLHLGAIQVNRQKNKRVWNTMWVMAILASFLFSCSLFRVDHLFDCSLVE